MNDLNTKANSDILSPEREAELLKPIQDHLAEIQHQIDVLRLDGSAKAEELQDSIQLLKEDRNYTDAEKAPKIEEYKREREAALKVAQQRKPQIDKLIKEGEDYLNAHFDKDYFQHVEKSVAAQYKLAEEEHQQALKELEETHQARINEIKADSTVDQAQELKDEDYVHKNRIFDAKVNYDIQRQLIKDRRHEAFMEKYHMIDQLRASRFTFGQSLQQRLENYRYQFNLKQFLLKNGLFIAIILVFILLGILAPRLKGTQLFTVNNFLTILQQASPRMFLALGVAGLILLTGTDLSIGRIVGLGMVASTIIMHNGPNTGSVFGVVFNFDTMPVLARVLLALVACVLLSVLFSALAGFFTARFKIHPFISTMSNMLIIFGLLTYATKGVSFGSIAPEIPGMIIPKINGFPTIILWAVAAVIVVWFIWNKTTFGKNLYAVGGNPEAASVSGISVFKITMGAFILAGVLYGFGSWLENIRMVGSGSAAYGQGWEMEAIAACVVGGVSFTGGIGKISGVVVGVLIFTALTYSLTILGIDTNLQFVLQGVIIMIAVTLDSLKYVQKK